MHARMAERESASRVVEIHARPDRTIVSVSARRYFSDRPSGTLESIILRCLQADPDRRYASARDLQHDLRRLAEGKRPRA